MDIQSIKRGIVLSRNEPFIKKTAKIPVPSSSPYIKFNVSSQQNTQQTYLQTSNKEISPLKHSPDKNHQVYPHSQTSIVINQVKTQEAKYIFPLSFNPDINRKSLKVNPLNSQHRISQSQGQIAFNNSKTVISTQDSFITNKDYQEGFSMERSQVDYNSTSILNEQSRISSNIITSQFQEEKSRLMAEIAGYKTQIASMNTQIHALRRANDQNKLRITSLENNNMNMASKSTQQKNSQNIARQLRVQIQKQYNEKMKKVQIQLNRLTSILEQTKLKSSCEESRITSYQAQISKLKQVLAQKQQEIFKHQHEILVVNNQWKTKTMNYESQIMKFKGNKNRLELDAENNKRLLQFERQKYQKQRAEINKLIFFQEDLIHAKDYQKVKEENAALRLETQSMYAEHKAYIEQTTQHRQALQLEIFKLTVQLKNINKQVANDRVKLHQFIDNNDRVQLIKVQNQSNFNRRQYEQMKSKNQDLMGVIKNREEEMADMRLILLQTKRNNEEKKSFFVDEMNIKNIQNTIAIYESRIQDMSRLIKVKQAQSDKNKRTVDYLTTELRKIRQENSIKNLKETNQENSLKDDIVTLKKGHEVQMNILQKKILNLQETIQRKQKQIKDKDIFINRIIDEKSKIETQYKTICKGSVTDRTHQAQENNKNDQDTLNSVHSSNVSQQQESLNTKQPLRLSMKQKKQIKRKASIKSSKQQNDKIQNLQEAQ